VQLERRDTKGARQSYQESLSIRRKRVEAAPDSAEAQRDLSVVLNRLGDVQLRQGDTKAALQSYQESLSIRRKLAEAGPPSAQFQRDLFVSYCRLGKFAEQSSDFRAAIEWYSKSRELPKALRGKVHRDLLNELERFFKQDVAFLDCQLNFCRFAAEHGIENLAAIEKQPADQQFRLLSAVQLALVQRKEYARAVKAADKLAGMAEQTDEVYNTACAFARCVPLADKEKAREELAARAMELLRQAVAEGYKDAAHMRMDTDLDTLRQRDDFHKLLAELEKPQPK
jgi:tetratricopeptide (TPR) repeat protein